MYCTDYGALHTAIVRGLCGCGPTHLRAGVLPAVEVVGTKLVKTLAGARQHQYAGAGRHGSTKTKILSHTFSSFLNLIRFKVSKSRKT